MNKHGVIILVGLGMLAVGYLGDRTPAAAQPGSAAPLAADVTLRTLFEELRPFLTADKALGQAREVKNVTIIPIATVGFGLGAGGGAGRRPGLGEDSPFAGSGAGGGGGAGVIPEAILVVSDEGVELLPIRRGALTGVAEALAPVILEGIRGRLRQGPAEDPDTQ